MQINELVHKVIQFRDDRNWKQFHSIRDLLLGLNIECGELAELFLWKSEEQIAQIPPEQIRHEIADVFMFLCYLTDHFGIDLEEAVLEKMKLNEAKYPVSKSYGKNTKYTDL